MGEISPTPSEKETERQYRVLRQTLSAHAALRDEYTAKAKFTEILLLVSAAIFCATTFAGDSFYSGLGLSPRTGGMVVGIASVLAFASSLALLVVDWKGSAARHSDAADNWTSALEEFRRLRQDDGSWPEEARVALSVTYWEEDKNSTEIPEKRFNQLKARYLRKVEVSKLISEYPGCPRLILALIVYARDSGKALRKSASKTREGDHAER